MDQPLVQAFMGGVAEVVIRRHALTVDLGCGELGQLGFAQHQRQVAAFGDLNRVGQAGGQIGKQRLHLRR